MKRVCSLDKLMYGVLVSVAVLLVACGGGITTKASTPTVGTTQTASTPAVGISTGSTAASAMRTFKVLADSSTAAYTVTERIFRLPAKTQAVGSAPVTGGTILLSLTDPSKDKVSHMTVDLRELKSDKDKRDNFLKTHGLESDVFPIAEFNSTSVEGLPASVKEGQIVHFKILGTMKVHNSEKLLTFDVTAMLQGATLSGTAVSHFDMTQFGVEPPDLFSFLKVDPPVTLTVKLVAKLV